MVRRHKGSGRSHTGGILSLREFIKEHKEAVESDLITSAGVELSDVGSSLSWGAFASFIKNLGVESATWRSVHPDLADWSSSLRTNIILADICDVLMQINANVCGGFSRKKSKHVNPYPRPWKDKKLRKIGRGALPPKALHEWVKNYRKK